MAGGASVGRARRETQELEVLAAAFYAARFASDWQSRPYWMVRRCVVPYVAVGQFLVVRREGLPVAFAGWACEREGRPRPWREDQFMPSAGQIEGPGDCVVTDMISGFLTPPQVVEQVRRYLGLGAPPAWVEWYPDRKFAAIRMAAAPSGE